MNLEKRIKDFLKDQGVPLAGIAGPERLHGPPSMSAGYILRNGKSIISLAMPMDVDAIYQFLSKKSPAPHNIDQCVTYQKIQHAAHNLADYLKSHGHSARAVPPSADYRRSPYVFSTKPSFSHRFGAVASGIAGQAWSGNVMTKKYGAAVHLATVVTEARLKSDPRLAPGYFIENFCKRCRRCAKACPSGMFSAKESEFVLINGELHERGRRMNIDLCNIACFGLHSLSRDKKWTNWGLHWIDEWIENPPIPSHRLKMTADLLKKGLSTGDSTQRFFILERVSGRKFPPALLYDIPEIDNLPKAESKRYEILSRLFAKVGIRGIDSYPIPMVCGHCALVCGPTLAETSRRYKMLVGSGLVVPGKDGKMTRVQTFDQAKKLHAQYPLEASEAEKIMDTASSLYLWHRHYFGFEPKTMIQGWLHNRKQEMAIKKQARHHG